MVKGFMYIANCSHLVTTLPCAALKWEAFYTELGLFIGLTVIFLACFLCTTRYLSYHICLYSMNLIDFLIPLPLERLSGSIESSHLIASILLIRIVIAVSCRIYISHLQKFIQNYCFLRLVTVQPNLLVRCRTKSLHNAAYSQYNILLRVLKF